MTLTPSTRGGVINTWITTPLTAELVRGAAELERTEHGLRPHRLPAWARAQTPDPQLAMVEAQPSGVRIVFRTRATAVELDTLATRRTYAGLPPRPHGVYDLLVDGWLAGQGGVPGGATLTIDMATGSTEHRPGPVGTVSFTGLPDTDKDVEIWLPHNEATELVALRTDAPVSPAARGDRPVWLHHGSSISHGSDAASPSTTWPALAAARGGVELINLGLGGSALLDPFTARAMRDTPADLISLKIGINVVNTDLMRLRAFGPAAPDLRDLGAGRLSFLATGDRTDPTRLTLTMIRHELSRIIAQRSVDDPHLHYLDGRELYGEADFAELPLPDQLHPDAATHRRIGERFADRVFGPGGPLATR